MNRPFTLTPTHDVATTPFLGGLLAFGEVESWTHERSIVLPVLIKGREVGLGAVVNDQRSTLIVGNMGRLDRCNRLGTACKRGNDLRQKARLLRFRPVAKPLLKSA